MDQYTETIKTWLDARFRECDDDGVYFAHQPIYGFRKGHCEPDWLSRYAITVPTLRALSRLPGRTFLDVGGAEGYKAWLVRKFLGLEVRSADLSAEASLRSQEIFNVAADAVDSHGLPYRDGEFDLVLSSESIEHVHDYRAAVDELIRVARRAVVITVPHDDPEFVRRNIEEKVPHGHIHAFDVSSFDYLKERGLRVVVQTIQHPFTLRMTPVIDAVPKETGRRTRFLYAAFNALTPLFRLVTGTRVAAAILDADPVLCRRLGTYKGLIFVILKDDATMSPAPRVSFKTRDVLNAAVPLHYAASFRPAPRTP